MAANSWTLGGKVCWENGMARSLLNARSLFSCVAFAALCIAVSGGPAGAKATYTTFNDGTVTGINASETVTGVAGDSSFIRTADGNVTTFAVPGATNTAATGINDEGTVGGVYHDNMGSHCFLRTADGTFTTFDVPGTGYLVEPRSINNNNEMAGYYEDVSQNFHSFVRTRSGKIETFDAPGAAETRAFSINDKGVIAGWYDHGTGFHSFLRAANGTITTIDVPAAESTMATSINIKGSVAGWYVDSSVHGFVRASDGTITTFNEARCDAIQPVGINRAGAVAGYCLRGRHTSGFIVSPSGKNLQFQVPNSGTRTWPVGINDAGVIAGNYGGGGFLRFP